MRCYNHAETEAANVCLGCLRALCSACASRHEHYCERGYEPSSGAAAIDRPCHHHSGEPARGICAGCGQPICIRCGGLVDGRLTCPDCRQRDDAPIGIDNRALQPAGRWSRVLTLAGVTAAAFVLTAVALVVAGALGHPSSLSAQAGSNASGSPADLVEQHYAHLAAGEYQIAWQQLSPSFQQLVDFQSWANSYDGTSIQPSGLEVTSESPTSATVVGDVTISSHNAAASLGRGQWTLALIEGTWRLDTTIYTSATSSDGTSASRSR